MAAQSRPEEGRLLAAGRRLLREARVIDWWALFYYPTLTLLAIFGRGASEGRGLVIALSLLLGAWALSAVVVGRSGLVRQGLVPALYYRLSISLPIVGSYLLLKTLLPIVRTDNYDAALYAIDVALFGVEPTLWLDRLVSPFLTEWLSFFYYLYFYLMTTFILGVLLTIDDVQIGIEFGVSATLSFCLGHLLYMIVPGYGPHSFLAGQFSHELPHGLFYGLVVDTVTQAGAKKDIFPSLHTAVPTLFTLFALRHRHRVRAFRYAWPVLAFIACNMIAATVYLRWHYLVDVLVGLVHASSMLLLATWVARWDQARSARLGLGTPWPQLKQPHPLGALSPKEAIGRSRS